MKNDLKPILIVNLADTDRRRIIHLLWGLDIECSRDDAEVLRKHLHPLPIDDEELAIRVIECVEVDWAKVPDRLEQSLRTLATQYDSASPGAAGDGYRRMVEQKMRVYTKGLDEHPDWWNHPCACDGCLSCAD